MKQVIFGLALVAVGMCTLTTKRSSADEYYNRGSRSILGEEESTGARVGGGRQTETDRKAGDTNRRSGSLDKNKNTSFNPRDSNELTYNIKIDSEEVEDIVDDF